MISLVCEFSALELHARFGVRRRRGSATMISMSSLPVAMPNRMMSANLPPATPVARLDPDVAWEQLVARDPHAHFFYGVTTTGVFCRPGCASRRPLRSNLRFFLTAAEAEAAGFRACKRCRPATIASSSPMDRVRTYIETHLDRRVSLEELGRVARLNPFTVQRLFKREMGVSPLQYQRALRANGLRKALKKGSTVTRSIYDAGFSSSSRAYEANQLGMTPQRFSRGGEGERIGFTAAHSPFGWIIVGATERGLCWLALAATKSEAEATLRAEFPKAALLRDPALNRWIERAIGDVCSSLEKTQSAEEQPQILRLRSPQKTQRTPLRMTTQLSNWPQNRDAGNPLLPNQTGTELLDLRGTVFQLRVWQALRQIPRGQTRSYSQLARELGDPKATRAVARACALNRVAILVPCHRVVGTGGSLTGYRWGTERKRRLLDAERS